MTLHNLILILSLVCFCIAAFALLATPRVNLIAAGLALFILSMFVTGCSTPLGQSINTYIHSPAGQANITALEQFAITEALNFFTHKNTTVAANRENAIERSIAAACTKFPKVPAGIVARTVRAKYAAQGMAR